MSYRNSFADNLKECRSPERAEFEDAIEREEQERAFAPIKAAEKEQSRLLSEIREAEKQDVLAGRRDPGFVLPAHMLNMRMSSKDANEFNCQQAAKFRDSCEEFRQFNTPENRELILTYLQNQSVCIADVETYKAAFLRLKELGLFLNENAAEPQAPAEPKLHAVQEAEPEPIKYVGIDGRQYTERDIWRMSSTELKQTFGLFGPRLPKFSDVIPA